MPRLARVTQAPRARRAEPPDGRREADRRRPVAHLPRVPVGSETRCTRARRPGRGPSRGGTVAPRTWCVAVCRSDMHAPAAREAARPGAAGHRDHGCSGRSSAPLAVGTGRWFFGSSETWEHVRSLSDLPRGVAHAPALPFGSTTALDTIHRNTHEPARTVQMSPQRNGPLGSKEDQSARARQRARHDESGDTRSRLDPRHLCGQGQSLLQHRGRPSRSRPSEG